MALLARAMGTFDPLSPWRVAGHGPPTSDEGSLLLAHVFDADEKGTGPHAGLAKYAGGEPSPIERGRTHIRFSVGQVLWAKPSCVSLTLHLTPQTTAWPPDMPLPLPYPPDIQDPWPHALL